MTANTNTTFAQTLIEIFDRGREKRLTRDNEIATIALAKTGDESATIALLYAYAPALRNAVKPFAETLEKDDARMTAVTAVLEAIQVAEDDEILAAVLRRSTSSSSSLQKALGEAAAATTGITVPSRTLSRFFGILRVAEGDVNLAASLAPSYNLATDTFYAVLQAVRSVDPLDGFDGADDERRSVIESARPIWNGDHSDVEDRVLVETAFAAVNEQERKVCRIAYGFEDYDPQPDAEVGFRVGLSRQKAQRVRTTALGKMRTAIAAA